MEGKRVMVAVWNRDGTLRTSLTYLAPPDAAVGDRGRVELFVPSERAIYFFDGTIQNLTTDYTGPCKPFVRTARAAPGAVR
jgi:hypothetical protein